MTLIIPPDVAGSEAEAAAAPASEAFRAALVAAIPKLRGHALALTQSSAEADDVVQEALLRAWKFRAGFQPGSNLNAWLNRIVRNTFYTSVRARSGTVQDVDGKYAAQVACEPDQEWRLKHAELMRALSELPRLAREALLLVVAQGLSYGEVAEICDCPIGTIKSRVNRARQQLALALDGDGLPAPARRSHAAAAMGWRGGVERSTWAAATVA